MRTLEKTISNLVADQFPAFYREEGPRFIAFLEAYYEWMESQGNPVYYSRRVMELGDIDQTIDDFVVHFKKTYLQDIQFDTLTNKRLLVKKVLDLYKAKGTERAIRLLFQIVFGEEIEIYYPSRDVLKASDGTWITPVYLEVTRSSRSLEFVGKQVTGVSTGATAFVDRIVRRYIMGKYVDIFFISNLSNDFKTGELLKIDDDLTDVPIVVGSLSNLTIAEGGARFTLGETVDILSDFGSGGTARVSNTTDVTGIVDFTLLDGGWGFTANARILVSNAVITVSNIASGVPDTNSAFKKFETFTMTNPSNGHTITANVMGISSNAVLYMNTVSGVFVPGETITSSNGHSKGKAFLVASGNTALSNVTVTNVTGSFTIGETLTGLTSRASGVLHNFDTTLGIISISDSLTNAYTWGVGSLSNSVANVVNVSTGFGAGFSIGSLSNTETVYVNDDFLGANNVLNQPYVGILLSANQYGFPKDPTANLSSLLVDALSYPRLTLGSILTLTAINPGIQYNVNPFVDIIEPAVAFEEKQDYYVTVAAPTGTYLLGEEVTQIVQLPDNYILIGVSTAENFDFSELIYQSNGTANTANGIIVAISTGELLVSTFTGAWNNLSVITGQVSGTTGNVISLTSINVTATAIGKVLSTNGDVIHVRRESISQDFAAGANMVGSFSGVTANVAAVNPDSNSLFSGDNAVVNAFVQAANGSVSGLQVVGAGFAYVDGELATFVSKDGLRSGTAIVHLGRQGYGPGYFSTSRGFLSSDKYLTDGNYYQNFSYEIRSSLDVSRYADMVKKVAHVSGTKMFGKISSVSEIVEGTTVELANVTVST